MAKISADNIIMLCKTVGYSKVAAQAGVSISSFKAHASGRINWNDEFEYNVLRALKEIGVLQEISLITKRARRELRRYEEKFKEQA